MRLKGQMLFTRGEHDVGASWGFQQDGRLNLEGDSVVRIDTNEMVNNGQVSLTDSTLIVRRSSDPEATFTNASTGRIEGTGTLDVSEISFINEGFISPGLSPGTLEILGDYVQSPAGTLVLEVSGGDEGPRDQIVITGNASLGGSIEVIFLGDYLPTSEDAFEFLTVSGTVEGQFDQATARGAGPGGGRFDIMQDGNSFMLTNYQPIPEPGAIGVLTVMSVAIGGRRRRRRANAPIA